MFRAHEARVVWFGFLVPNPREVLSVVVVGGGGGSGGGGCGEVVVVVGRPPGLSGDAWRLLLSVVGPLTLFWSGAAASVAAGKSYGDF